MRDPNLRLHKIVNTRKAYLPYLYPAALMGLLLVVLPLALLLLLSFFDWNLSQNPIPTFTGLDNYSRMLTDAAFGHSLLITTIFVIESVALQVVLGVSIAVLFNQALPGMNLIRTLFLTPMMIAPLFAGMIWRLMFNNQFGIIKYLFSLIGIYRPPLWLADPSLALHSVVIVNTWMWTPFVVLFVLAGLQTIPLELYEAASLDGATRLRTFFGITLPLLKPILVIIVLFRGIDSFKIFDIIFAMTRGGPGSSTETVSYHIYQETLNFFELGYSSVLALVVFLIVIAFSWLLLHFTRQRGGLL